MLCRSLRLIGQSHLLWSFVLGKLELVFIYAANEVRTLFAKYVKRTASALAALLLRLDELVNASSTVNEVCLLVAKVRHEPRLKRWASKSHRTLHRADGFRFAHTERTTTTKANVANIFASSERRISRSQSASKARHLRFSHVCCRSAKPRSLPEWRTCALRSSWDRAAHSWLPPRGLACRASQTGGKRRSGTSGRESGRKRRSARKTRSARKARKVRASASSARSTLTEHPRANSNRVKQQRRGFAGKRRVRSAKFRVGHLLASRRTNSAS